METKRTFTAFAGQSLIHSGEIETLLSKTKKRIDDGETERILIFEDQTGKQTDFNFRGSLDDVLARLPEHPLFSNEENAKPKRSGPGRPKLGVVSREISLLPRHWQWLEEQPNGISAALRRLVDQARKSGQGKHLARRARDAAGNFMWAMAGDLPDFEEASRAMYAKEVGRFEELIADWPRDIRDHLKNLFAEFLRLDQEASADEAAKA